MVNARLRETARLAFSLRARDILTLYIARPRLQSVLNPSARLSDLIPTAEFKQGTSWFCIVFLMSLLAF